MSTNLTSVSTYGWWPGDTAGQLVPDELEPVSTYGWWVTVVTLGQPEIVPFDVYVKRTFVNVTYIDQSKVWSIER